MRKFHKLIATALATAMTVSLLAGCGSTGGAESSSGAGDGTDAAQESAAPEGEEATAQSDAEGTSKPVLDAVEDTVQTEVATVVDPPGESMTIALTSASFDVAPFVGPMPGTGPFTYLLWAKLFFPTNAAATF